MSHLGKHSTKTRAATDSSGPNPTSTRAPNRKGLVLWIVAAILMLGSAAFQRLTGPTHPIRGSVEISGTTLPYKLIRSDWSARTNESAQIVLPDPLFGTGGPELRAELHFRRYRSTDQYEIVPMRKDERNGENVLVGLLPAQPAAGKLEYYLSLHNANQTGRIPPGADEIVVIRFKDHVPIEILVPHVAFMFFAVLFGIRAGLGALFEPRGMRVQSWVALIGMTIGGMVLGPIVQKFAFGAFWTGFPNGGDWTDNKMLVMWVVWIVGCAVLGFGPRPERRLARVVVFLAALVMSVAYLIPHSTRGSELDYSQIDAGMKPIDAIETGR